jgi:hypothetical protein
MKSRILLYQQTPAYSWWLKLILGGILALTFILGLVLISIDITGALAFLGVTLFDALLFWVIMPRRFCIYEDRLSIKLGGPLAFDVSLASIKGAKRASSSYVIGYWGLRFATSTSGVVEIVRCKGMNVVISLTDPDAFLDELERARRSLATPL